MATETIHNDMEVGQKNFRNPVYNPVSKSSNKEAPVYRVNGHLNENMDNHKSQCDENRREASPTTQEDDGAYRHQQRPQAKPKSDNNDVKYMTITQLAQKGKLEELMRRLTSVEDESRRHTLANSRDERGVGLLHHAARYGHVQLVKALLDDYGADIKNKDQNGLSVMHYACEGDGVEDNDQSQMLTLLLNNGADVVAVDKFGTTAMHTAASCGMTSAADWLISLSLSDPDALNPNLLFRAKNSEGGTPLHEAAKKSQLGVAGVLLERAREFGDAVDAGALLEMQDERGNTPLHAAAQHGGLGAVQLLVEKAKKAIEIWSHYVNQTNKIAKTPMHYAVEEGNLKVVKYLVEQGARACFYETLGKPAETMLHIACAAGDREIIKCLLGAGAEIDLMARDEYAATPLHCALNTKDVKVATLLLNWRPKMLVLLPPLLGKQRSTMVSSCSNDSLSTPLAACCYNRDDMARNIIRGISEDRKRTEASGKNPDDYLYKCSFDDRSISAINAISHGDCVNELGKTLVNIPNDEGYTPLHICASNGLIACVQLLVDTGAVLDAKNHDGETPFLLAADAGHRQICELLIEASNNNCLGDEDMDFNKALHVAARGGHLDLIHLLIDKKAIKDERNLHGMAPLDMAAEFSHRPVINFLIGRNSPFDDSFDNQTLRLHIACSNGHVNAVKQLLQEGVDVKKRNRFGLNPLDVAIESKQSGVAAAIIESSQWREALMNAGGVKVLEEEEDGWDGTTTIGCRNDTPIRKLIRTMPDVATLAFNKCITIGQEKKGETVKDDRDLFVEFNFEFIDDTFACFGVNPNDVVDENDDVYDDSDMPTLNAKRYNKKSAYIKNNHPLSIMIKHNRADLLFHPLVLALISRKFEISWPFYFSLLIFFVTYLAVLTAYLIRPNHILHIDMEDWTCDKISIPYSNWYHNVGPALLCIFSAIGLFMEAVQIVLTRINYFKTFTNLLDWLAYVLTILCAIDFSGCHITQPWQWQLGAFAVFFAWMNLILFLRRFPWVGIYVLMVYNVLTSFIRFMVVFLLFIIAFNFSFYILLQNQINFETIFYSIMKTWTMMLGEIDYTDTFHKKALNFEAATYVIFIVFLVIASIIINNLLTGLAVDDVQALKEGARIATIKLQIDLALDIEVAMARRLQRTLRTVVRREVYHADTKPHWWMRPMYMLQQEFCKKEIRKQALRQEVEEVYREENQDDRMRMHAEATMAELKKMTTQLTKTISKGVEEEKQGMKVTSEDMRIDINNKLASQDAVLEDQRKEMDEMGRNLKQVLLSEDNEVQQQRGELIQIGNRLNTQLQAQDEQLQIQLAKVKEISDSLLKRMAQPVKEAGGIVIPSSISKRDTNTMLAQINSQITAQGKQLKKQEEELADMYRHLSKQMFAQAEIMEAQQVQLHRITGILTSEEGMASSSDRIIESLRTLGESLSSTQRDSATRQQELIHYNAILSDNVNRRLTQQDGKINEISFTMHSIKDMLLKMSQP